jgi:hypothetical protein
VTPAVIIRITLAPIGRGRAIFGSPRAVAGAVRPIVKQTPTTGSSYVPVQTADQATGQTGGGAVFVPRNGSNVVNAATWAPAGGNPIRQAGNWIVRQARKTPAVGRRIKKVQVLVDGKPCPSCVKQLAKTVSTVAPNGAKLKVRFTNPGRGTAATTATTASQKRRNGAIRPTTANATSLSKPTRNPATAATSTKTSARVKPSANIGQKTVRTAAVANGARGTARATPSATTRPSQPTRSTAQPRATAAPKQPNMVMPKAQAAPEARQAASNPSKGSKSALGKALELAGM